METQRDEIKNIISDIISYRRDKEFELVQSGNGKTPINREKVKEYVLENIAKNYPGKIMKTLETLYTQPENVILYYMKIVLPPAFLREAVKLESNVEDNEKFKGYFETIKIKFPKEFSDYDLKFRLQELYESISVQKPEDLLYIDEKSKLEEKIEKTFTQVNEINPIGYNLSSISDFKQMKGTSVYFKKETKEFDDVYRLVIKKEHPKYHFNFFLDPCHTIELSNQFKEKELPEKLSGIVKEISEKKPMTAFSYSVMDGTTVVFIKVRPSNFSEN